MKIGLVRHFKVNCAKSNFMTSCDFDEWVKQYDSADIIENEVELGNIIWHKCFSSDLPRAMKTAETIFKGEVVKSNLLREVPLSSVFKTNFKVPHILWAVSGRIAWLFSHNSQSESKEGTEKRVREFLTSIEIYSNKNILIVCHGFLMRTFQKELKNRKFHGKTIQKAKNGTLYVYEK